MVFAVKNLKFRNCAIVREYQMPRGLFKQQVCEILHWNSKRLLRNWPKNFRGYIFATHWHCSSPHCRDASRLVHAETV